LEKKVEKEEMPIGNGDVPVVVNLEKTEAAEVTEANDEQKQDTPEKPESQDALEDNLDLD
jgi:hypothetical protein